MLEQKIIKLIKEEEDLLDKAIILVNQVFKNKTDKSGVPYINHLYFVCNNVNDYISKVVGILHDVVEDTDVTLEQLKALGFPSEVLEALALLTRDKRIDYNTYIDNILNSNNIVAIRVKKADMMHNMDKDRMQSLDEQTRNKLTKKYNSQYTKINNKLKEIEQ